VAEEPISHPKVLFSITSTAANIFESNIPSVLPRAVLSVSALERRGAPNDQRELLPRGPMTADAQQRSALTTKHGLGFAILIAIILDVGAAAQAPLTSLAAIRALSNADANKHLPVAIVATVTYFSAARDNLFVQDIHTAVRVWGASEFKLSPGDRILIRGTTASGFLPGVNATNITVVGHATLPKPVPASFADLVSARLDSMLVTVRGAVRTANPDSSPGSNTDPAATLGILTDSGSVNVVVNSASASELEKLLDSEVAVTGVAGGTFDSKRQQVGAALRVSSLADVEILRPAPVNPWSLSATPMDAIIRAYHLKDLSSRVRVTGAVTYFEPGLAMVLQSGAKSLWIRTDSIAPVRIGDRADAIGFPSLHDGLLNLIAGQVRDLGFPAPVTPQSVTWRDLISAQRAFDFVSIDGKVAVTARETAQDEYVLAADGYEFSAILHHAANGTAGQLPPMKDLLVGTQVRVVGVCVPDSSTPFRRNAHFNILLRSADDIVVLAAPPWWTRPYLLKIAGVLLILALVVGALGWHLEHKTRREIASLAHAEQRRGRILEDINNSEPLADTIERITELVSARLQGAPCWCVIADGVAVGNRPDRLVLASLRTVECPIAARGGRPLGTISAAFDARTKPDAAEREALAGAADLASLAMRRPVSIPI